MKKISQILILFSLLFQPLSVIANDSEKILYKLNTAISNYVEGNYNVAKELFLELADQENHVAEYNLGLMFQNGDGVRQSEDIALSWFRKAANKGDIKSQYRLGLIYLDKKSYKQAFNWIKMAADNDDLKAQNALGNMYEQGLGIQKSYTNAIEWYEKAANRGYYLAQYNLGYVYRNTTDPIIANYEKAAYWYNQAAEQGYSFAQNNLGLMYEEGSGVEKDYELAAYWYQKASDQGYAVASYNLGYLYKNASGLFRDYQKAYKWLNVASNQGNTEAQIEIAYLYANGQGVQKDLYYTYYWASQAANAGNIEGMFLLASLYEKGRGVKQDLAKALEWYSQAANQGYTAAQNNLGYMYEKGIGVEQDYLNAVYWYEKAAQTGDRLALNNLGNIFEKGLGVEIDREKAARLYKVAKSKNYSYLFNDLRYCEIKTTHLFSLPIKCLNINEFEQAVQNAQSIAATEAQKKTERKVNAGKTQHSSNKIVFDSKMIFEGSHTLTVNYDYGNRFAKATYKFKTKERDYINKLLNRVSSKYGDPSQSYGVDYYGKYSFIWNMADGVKIELYRDFPNVTTYLEITSPKHYNEMLIERKRRNLVELRRQEALDKQFYAF